jgi:hypothetical protein
MTTRSKVRRVGKATSKDDTCRANHPITLAYYIKHPLDLLRAESPGARRLHGGFCLAECFKRYPLTRRRFSLLTMFRQKGI